MKSNKTNQVLSFFLLLGLLFSQGPVLSYPILSSGAVVDQETYISSGGEIIESGVIYEADEGILRSWWIFSFQNKVYRFEEFKYVDELPKNKGMKPINTNKAKEAFIHD